MTKTEESYVHWILRFIRYHELRHPREMGDAEVQAFLTHLAVRQKVSASTQNQASSAVVFLFRHVLKKEIDIPSYLFHAQIQNTARCPYASGSDGGDQRQIIV